MRSKNDSSIPQLVKDWEELADLDPLWAILTEKRFKFGKWDQRAFLLTGKSDVRDLMHYVDQMGYPKRLKTALDFGCGVGRITGALASYFEECYGVDISAKMLERAHRMNQDISNCRFVLNNQYDLNIFPDENFDLIYCKLVLQHLPSKHLIRKYISEFCRTLRLEGLLVFQLPSSIPLFYRLEPSRRAYHLLRRLGIGKEVIFRLGLDPITIMCVPEPEVCSLLQKMSVKLLNVMSDASAGPRISSRTYFVTK